MGHTLPKADAASHREELASVRPKPAKVDLHAQAGASRLRDVAAETIRTVSGNARAASIDMDIHEAHLSRLLKDGTIRLEQLEALGPAFAAKFGQHLVEQFGELASPKDHARRVITQIEAALLELKQFIEDAA